MTLSKQKGPRKNGPFCLLIFISGGGSSAFYISIKVFRRNTAWRERRKSASTLKGARSGSVSDEIIQVEKKQTKKDPTLCAGQL